MNDIWAATKATFERIARKNSSDRWSPPLATPCSVAVRIQWIRISRRLAGCHSNDMLLHQIVWCLATPMICYRIVAYMLFHPIALYCTVSCHFNDMLLHRIVWCLVTSMICFCIKLYGVLPLKWYAIVIYCIKLYGVALAGTKVGMNGIAVRRMRFAWHLWSRLTPYPSPFPISYFQSH